MSKPKYTKAQIKANRKAWLEALRSGKYKQAQGTLRKRNGAMCCLGVACELAHQAGVTERQYNDGEYRYGTEFEGTSEKQYADWRFDSATELPTDVMEWLGVDSSAPDLASPVTIEVYEDGEPYEVSNLIQLNDDHGFTFAQIADAIEEHGLR